MIYQPNNAGQIQIDLLNDGVTLSSYELSPDGPSIEGWRRIYDFIRLHPSADEMRIAFLNKDGAHNMHVDDLRIYPFDGNMKSFVYHPASLKLMAELDENNHATFYEYDEEWNLVRVKKETERGVVTSNEHRSHSRIDRD